MRSGSNSSGFTGQTGTVRFLPAFTEVVKDQYRRFFVKRHIVVPALGGVDAGGAPFLAPAVPDKLKRCCKELMEDLICLLGKPDPAFIGIVHKDCRFAIVTVHG